jgi:glycosyltransferase involved in cell wall biosynthesis
MKPLTVVIPSGQKEPLRTTLDSLERQTFRDFETIVVFDEGCGANWARNQGFAQVRTPLVIFSDDDIRWYAEAFECLLLALQENPQASYAYGAYRMGTLVQCNQPFDAKILLRHNIASTMSMIRSDHFPGFDERIERLQDYDLWLTMLERGHVGVYCGRLIFETDYRPGITYGSRMSYDEAFEIIRVKHAVMRGECELPFSR